MSERATVKSWLLDWGRRGHWLVGSHSPRVPSFLGGSAFAGCVLRSYKSTPWTGKVSVCLDSAPERPPSGHAHRTSPLGASFWRTPLHRPPAHSVETTGPWHKLLSEQNWDSRDLSRQGFRGGVSASRPGMVSLSLRTLCSCSSCLSSLVGWVFSG